MPKTLVLTTDLPYFPGKMGVDFFNLRFLAQHTTVGVVGPLHDFFPAEGMKNLETFLRGKSYFWPRPPSRAVTLPPQRTLSGWLRPWLERLRPEWREALLLRLLGIAREPADTYSQLATLANCAPQLLSALADESWQVVALIQTNTAPWLDYLPAHLPRMVYVHDVRSHAVARQTEVAGDAAKSAAARDAVARQERRICREAEVVGFVSALDEKRARQTLQPRAETGVAPIPVDTDYYTPAPAGWRRPDDREIVLFTGHLSHPPNVDAVEFFLASIWPGIRARRPTAVFQVVGCLPAPSLQQAVRQAASLGVELHPDVPDIRPYFWNAAAYVVPMRFGGGVRQKIFEAWAMRAPVVCTTMAAEGTRAEHARNCWLEDAPAGFAARVAELLESGAPADALAHAAETVATHNSIPAAASRFEQLIHRAAAIKRQRPFKLLFDLRWMEIGKAGGVEQLAYEHLHAIAALDRRNAYRVLCPRSTFYEWNFPANFQCRGVFTDPNEAKAEALRAAVTDGLAGSLDQQPILNAPMRGLRRYRELDFDLVHSVCSYIHPDLAAFPNVVTMLDLQHRHFPEFFSAQELADRETLYRGACARARHILCISEATRRDIHREYGVPLERMTAVWIIPSRAAWMRLDPGRARAALARMGLVAGRFLFYPAHSWPHKNHARLIAALAMVAKELPADMRLVLTGRAFEPSHPAHALIAEHRLEKRVLHLGYRSPLEIRALYGGASALIFPSLFEGFGMPVAEAMIAGCPVACSNTTSLPEIAGDAAITFDPTSVSEIAHALQRVINDATLREALIAAGQRRRPLFSARLSAVKTLAVYQRVFDEFYGA